MGPNVNRPTVASQRDKSVSEKLQLFGIYSAFAQGKMPTNQQIDVALNSALTSKALAKPSDRLSKEGQKLVSDLVDVIKQSKYLLLSKNEGQLLQQFVWSTETAGRSITQERQNPNREKSQSFIAKEEALKDRDQALAGLKSLGKLIVTNGQFRKLLNDALILARSVAGEAATKVAGRVNPSEEQLAQIDAPAAGNSWATLPDYGEGGLKGHLKQRYNHTAPWSKKKKVDSLGHDVLETETTVSADDSATVSSNVSRTKMWQNKASAYWDEKMPEQRRDSAMKRIKLMVNEIQGHQDYQDAILTLLNLADSYGSRVDTYSRSGAGKTQAYFRSKDAVSAEHNLKTLLERFANSTSLDDLFDSVKVIQDRARSDPELKGCFSRIQTFIRRCLQETGYVVHDDCTNEWHEIHSHVRALAREKYHPEFKHLFHEIQTFFKQFDADPQNKAFANSVQKLCLDLGQDENGKPQFKPHLVKDLTYVIIPAFLENLSYVPLPRIEYSDHMIDLVVENLIIESDNLTPNSLEVKSDNHWRWGRKKIVSANKNKVMLAVSGVQMDMRDISYYVNKKSGFPSLKDTGVMDIFLGGKGLSFLIEMETADRFVKRSLTGGAHFFKASDVKVNIDDFNIKLKKSSHKLLFSLVRPILVRLIKPIVAKVAAAQIKKTVAEFDEVAWQISQEVDRSRSADKLLPPEERVNQPTYRRYADIVKKRYLAKKQRQLDAAEKKRLAGQTGVFKLVMTEDQTMFPDVKLKGGITAKATEYRNLAFEGTGWESPVFAIGRGKPSSDIPTVAKVIRKSTWTGIPKPAKPQTAKAGLGGSRGGIPVGPGQGTYGAGQGLPPRSLPRPLQTPSGNGLANDDSAGLPIDGATYERAINPDTYQNSGLGSGVPSSIDTSVHSTQRFSNNSTMVDTPLYHSSAREKAGQMGSNSPNHLSRPGAAAQEKLASAQAAVSRHIPGGFAPSVPQTPDMGNLSAIKPDYLSAGSGAGTEQIGAYIQDGFDKVSNQVHPSMRGTQPASRAGPDRVYESIRR